MAAKDVYDIFNFSNEDAYKLIGSPHLTSTPLLFYGPQNSTLKPFGSFSAKTEFDNKILQATFRLENSPSLQYSMLLDWKLDKSSTTIDLHFPPSFSPAISETHKTLFRISQWFQFSALMLINKFPF